LTKNIKGVQMRSSSLKLQIIFKGDMKR